MSSVDIGFQISKREGDVGGEIGGEREKVLSYVKNGLVGKCINATRIENVRPSNVLHN